MNSVMRCLKWLTSRDRRRAERHERLPLVAHYWDGGAPTSHTVRNISARGLYIVTEQRWYPGTLVMLSLQREDIPQNDPDRTISVNAKVIRSGDDGVGFSLVMPTDMKTASQNRFGVGADKKTFLRFLHALGSSHGQALVEYAFTLPLILLLIVNVVNFAGFFFAWITVANAARAGADYAVLGSASAGGNAGTISTPNATQISNVIKADVSSLPNSASVSINICQAYNGTIVSPAVAGSCSSTGAPADPEPTTYTFRWIDVTYTYVPFISAGFNFPGMNIYATIPPTTIQRRVVIRMIE
jgi:Flp pilus assembly protein TadG